MADLPQRRAPQAEVSSDKVSLLRVPRYSDLSIVCPAGQQADGGDEGAAEPVFEPVKIGRTFCVCGTYGAHFHNRGHIDLDRSCEIFVRCRVLKDGAEVLKKDARPEIVGKWSTRHTFETAPNQGDRFLVEAQLFHKTAGAMSPARTFEAEYDSDAPAIVCTGECRDFLHSRNPWLAPKAEAVDSEENTRVASPDITIVCPVDEKDAPTGKRAGKGTRAPAAVGDSFCVCGTYGARFQKRVDDLSTSCRLQIHCEVKRGGTTVLEKNVRPEVLGKWSTRFTWETLPSHGDLFVILATLIIGGTEVDHTTVDVQYTSAPIELVCSGPCGNFLRTFE
jgi:hypothetical protein